MAAVAEAEPDPNPPAFPGLDLGVLRSLSFATGAEAVKYLKAQATSHGFELSQRDSSASDRVRLLCHRSNYGRGKKTTKTDCPVYVLLHRRDNAYSVAIPDEICHNHPLETFPAANVPENVANSVRHLLTIGVTNLQIIQFIEKETGFTLSRYDVDAFREPALAHAMLGETDSLLANLAPTDTVFIMTQDFQGEERRAGILIITESEMRNLQRFGDVIWLDGTTLKNDLGWTTWPITLCDDRKELASGGVFLTAFENKDAFVWLLRTLEPLVQPVLRTFFSDEDSALCPAIEEFQQTDRPDVAHRICRWHKRKNFQKQVVQARVPPETRDEALRLFDAICSYPAAAEVEEAVAKIRLLVPSISEYLDAEIVERLPLFTEAFRNGVLTLGYEATTLSESANHLIRRVLRPAILTLQDIRAGVTQAYSIKALGTAHTVRHEFQSESRFEATFKVKLQKPILRWIDQICAEADLCTVHFLREAEGCGFYEVAVEGRRSYLVKVDRGEAACECDQLAATGMPCPHLVALYQEAEGGAFPVGLIARRWIPDVADVVIPALPHLSLPEVDLALQVFSDALTDEDDGDFDSDEEYDDEDEDQDEGGLPEGEEPEGEEPAPPDQPPRRATAGQSRRYQALASLGKQIATKAAETEEMFTRAEATLKGLLHSCTETVDGEIRDARGRPRGRPRKNGHSRPETSHAAPRQCPLCDSIAHAFERCVHYPIFEEERRRYPGSTDGRHCSLCNYGGHRKDGCPVMRLARARIDEVRVTRRRH
jgi:hypothetical protein